VDLQFLAQADALEGKLKKALGILEDCGACQAPRACAQLRLGLAERLGDRKLREAAENGLISAFCVEAESCAEGQEQLGSRALARGDFLSALSRFSQAADRAPTPERYARVVELALKAGQVQRARHALGRFQTLGGRDSALEQRVRQAELRSVP
jgi:hypothetical protein